VVLVHAAAFPSYRLCLQNQPDREPIPDAKAMPEANLVGVEVGSVVRVDPLEAPGEIYAIDVRAVKTTVGSVGKTCRDLICTGGSSCLLKNRDYHVVGKIDQAIGTSEVVALALTGCGDQYELDDVGVPSTNCGAGWDALVGNLALQQVTLRPGSTIASATTLPTQLVHMSWQLDALRGTQPLKVTFGPLGGTPAATVAQNPPLYQTNNEIDLKVDQSDAGVYAAVGFRIGVTGTTPEVAIDQSLADVQALSSPRDTPDVYYRAASNYVLLLLGDPAVSPKLGDGGANPTYDPRRGVHLLAVPVIDPSQADAGAHAGDGG
jgi:hypothetical protein